MPLSALNVFDHLLVKLVTESTACSICSDVNDIEFTIVASGQEYLLVLSIPSHGLNFICMKVSITSLDLQVVEVPDSNCLIG